MWLGNAGAGLGGDRFQLCIEMCISTASADAVNTSGFRGCVTADGRRPVPSARCGHQHREEAPEQPPEAHLRVPVCLGLQVGRPLPGGALGSSPRLSALFPPGARSRALSRTEAAHSR